MKKTVGSGNQMKNPDNSQGVKKIIIIIIKIIMIVIGPLGAIHKELIKVLENLEIRW